MVYESNYLMHYGVKGMKWGVRHERELLGYRRRSQGQTNYSANARSARRSRNLKKIAIGAAAIGGAGLAIYGGHKVGKLLASEAGRAAITAAKNNALFKASKVSTATRNTLKTGKTIASTPMRLAKNTRAGQVVSNVRRTVGNNPVSRMTKSNPVYRYAKSTRLGSYALKGLAAATLISDVNSVKQWSEGVHDRGKITKKDVKNLLADIANPIPDNLPGISKKKKKR